ELDARKTLCPVLAAGQVCPLYHRKRTSSEATGMSALCQTLTNCSAAKRPLLDHLVGAREQRPGHLDAERPRGLEVDHQRILYRRLDRQVGCLLTPQNAIDVAGGLPMLLDVIGSVGDQPAAGSESAAG